MKPDPIEPAPDALRALLEQTNWPEPPADLEARLLQSLRPKWAAGIAAAGIAKWVAMSAAGAFVIGAVSGAAVWSWRSAPPPAPIVIRVEVPVPTPAPPTPVAEPPRTPEPPRPTTARPRPPADDAALAEEQRLVETARAALVRHEPQLAMEPLTEHCKRFAHGQLAEERDVLEVQALLNLGRRDEAVARAEAFHRAHPDSVLGPAIDAALNSAP